MLYTKCVMCVCVEVSFCSCVWIIHVLIHACMYMYMYVYIENSCFYNTLGYWLWMCSAPFYLFSILFFRWRFLGPISSLLLNWGSWRSYCLVPPLRKTPWTLTVIRTLEIFWRYMYICYIRVCVCTCMYSIHVYTVILWIWYVPMYLSVMVSYRVF